jgi:opacity protein-like surface antigen
MITTISRIATCSLLACVALGVAVQPAYAQRPTPAFGASDGPRQTINFTFGGSRLTGIADRDNDDVIVANLDLLEFDPDEITKGSWIAGVEWLVPIGSFVEAGAGIAFSGRREAASRYRDFVEEGTLADIEQDISLRVMPLSFTIRAVALGQRSPVQPYVGGGLGLFRYEYVEEGDFLDFAFDPPAIFVEAFEAKGWQPGLILLGGVRWASDSATVGGEFRYHRANVDLDTDAFVAPKLSLNGWIFQFTVGARF